MITHDRDANVRPDSASAMRLIEDPAGIRKV